MHFFIISSIFYQCIEKARC